jgi:alpha-galactosidase
MLVLLLLELLDLATAYNNGSPNSRLPPLGWSSWEAFGPGTSHPVRDYCDENSVLAGVEAFFANGLYDAGYRHIHLDDCWSIVERNATGFIQADPNRFPNGMKKVIDVVHSNNLTFGLYTSGGYAGCMPSRAGSRGHWEQDAAVFAEWGGA